MSQDNGYATLDALKAPRPVPEEDVEIPGVGKIRIRGFGVRQRTAFELSVNGKTRNEVRERLLVATIVKPEGITAEHIKLLSSQDCRVWEPAVEAAMRITGLQERDLEAAVKNSDATGDDDSISS